MSGLDGAELHIADVFIAVGRSESESRSSVASGNKKIVLNCNTSAWAFALYRILCILASSLKDRVDGVDEGILGIMAKIEAALARMEAMDALREKKRAAMEKAFESSEDDFE